MKHSIPQHSEDSLLKLMDRLYHVKGWDFRNYKETSLKRRISKRFSANNISSYEDYHKILESNPDEYEKLFSTITVKVSEFFREPEVFDLLARELSSSEFYDKKGLRAWCCGCAYGEEAYSLGMLLHEYLKPESMQDTKIFATDIDNEALEVGRAGIYREELVYNVNNALRQRHFIKTDKGYKVRYDIRNKVRFGRIDIVKDPPLSKIDILFCRNLFIYFDHTLQKEVFQKLNFALKPGGIMVLGKVEIMPALFASDYQEIKEGSRVYRKGGKP